MPAEYLLCRDRSISHDWDILKDFHLDKDRYGRPRMTRYSRCIRCTTQRWEYFDHTGPQGYLQKTSSRYDHPEGYSIVVDENLGPVRSGEVWSELSRRARVKR